jgi:tetratricopeptide (TPR) repeat protein
MNVIFECHGCHKKMSASSELAGRHARCRSCGATTLIPPATEDEAPLPVMPVADPAEPVHRPPAGPSPAQGQGNGDDVTALDELPMGEIVLARPASAGTGIQTLQRRLIAVNTMVEQRRFLEATQALKTLAAEGQEDPGYHYLAGMAYSGLGNYPHALDHLNRAVAGGVGTPPVYASKGKAELELGQFGSAIESLDAALDLAGTDVPDYMADLAKAYDGARMPRDAVATWNALAQISPNHPALLERERTKQELRSRKLEEQRSLALVQMQKEQKASDTACWICIILRILLECM